MIKRLILLLTLSLVTFPTLSREEQRNIGAVASDAPKLAFFEESKVVCTEKGVSDVVLSSLKEMRHNIDNEHIVSYIGLSGKIGNAMGVKILHHKDSISFDVGIDRRKDAWSTTHLIMFPTQ